jgi:hypothetical protein
MTRVLAFILSLVLVIAAASVAVQAQPNGRGRGRGGAPPANDREGGPPEWAKSHKDPVAVPEPSTLLLLAFGAGGLAVKAVRNRRNRKL